MSEESAEGRFRRLYELHYRMVFAYALRRCQDRNEAHDMVAETFLVVWRRFKNAPAADEEVPLWLHAIARRVLANHHRGRGRRERLLTRLTRIQERAAEGGEREANRQGALAVLRGLFALRSNDRELLLLAAWDQLSTREIAGVLGCSENAAALRIHRARGRLAKVVEKESGESGHRRDEAPKPPRPEEVEER
jgi:RNA polymerase sigma factor (sigma-70 family)